MDMAAWQVGRKPVIVEQLRRGDTMFVKEPNGATTTIIIVEVMSDGDRMDVAFSTINGDGSSESFEVFKLRLNSIFGFFDSWSGDG